MLSLIIVFVFALGVAYFAIQNTFAVPIVLGGTVLHDIPLYFLVIAAILLGIILASVISSIDTMATYMKLRGKENQIHSNEHAIDDLQQKVHNLEIENAQLKTASGHSDTPEETQTTHRPTFMGGLLHPHAKA